MAAAAPEELEPTEARGLQAPVSSNSFCTARLRATVPVGGGGGGWFSLAKGVATRWRPRGDGVGERDRVEEAVERRGLAGMGVGAAWSSAGRVVGVALDPRAAAVAMDGGVGLGPF